eukprot:7318252-Ditylum_brightwellii.AAC.1
MVRPYYADGYPLQRNSVVETLTGSYQYWVRSVPDDDIPNPTKAEQQKYFDKAIRNCIDGTLGDPKFVDLDENDLVLEPRNQFEDDEVTEPVEPNSINEEPDDYTPEAHG